MEFWDSMEISRKLVTKKWWNIFGFLLLLLLINFAGALVFFVGLLFTIPITYCALYAAFEDIVGTE
jgi:NhaP-type Na+/H+ or K+/H+ antiporter